MPTIGVSAEALFAELNDDKTTYNPENFAELCFDFGIELDDFEDGELKIEIPANRYDMLCYEGIATQLKVFLGKQAVPKYSLDKIPESKLLTLTVSKEVAKVRPYVASAILRNVTFDETRYNSFIELQDKLHQNLARQRTLVSIGTHDLDTLQGPFTYEGLPPKDISFIPLNQTKKMNAAELMEFYEKDKNLGRYLNIIRDAPVYPVIFDANRVVCSLPPIINSEHSKITLDTKNVFIEITATDKTKLDVVCNIITTMFSEYCSEPFVIEPVKIISPHDDMTRITPSLANREFEVEVEYINKCLGLALSAPEIAKSLEKMSYTASPSGKDKIKVIAPSTRADVLHACDIMEDVGIVYGFNKLPRIGALQSVTIGKSLRSSKLSNIVRLESAMAGWVEVLNLVLCSLDENFKWMNRKDDGQTAIKIANPKSLEFQCARTSLVPGLLLSLRENRSAKVPLKIMEVADVVFKDESLERKARNERHWAAAYYGKTAGFEIVHGLLDRIMAMLKIRFIGSKEAVARGEDDGYFHEAIEHPTYIKGRAVAIYLKHPGQEKVKIGEMGALAPTVLDAFDLSFVGSVVELNLEHFL